MTVEAHIIGSATVYHGDCRVLLPAMARIGALVCDPPYGIGYVHNGCGVGIHSQVRVRRNGRDMHRGNNTRNAGMKIAGDDAPFDPAMLLARGVPTLMWGAQHYAPRLPAGTWVCWDKSPGALGPADNFADGDFAWCNFPVKRNVIRYLWKGVACSKVGEENGFRYHPSTKPQGLMLRCLRLLPAIDGPVVDPYMGSGSTGVACATLGIPFVGIELERRHFDVACERLERAHAQGRLSLEAIA